MYYYGEIPLNDFDNAWKTIEMYIHTLAITIGIYFIIDTYICTNYTRQIIMLQERSNTRGDLFDRKAPAHR